MEEENKPESFVIKLTAFDEEEKDEEMQNEEGGEMEIED